MTALYTLLALGFGILLFLFLLGTYLERKDNRLKRTRRLARPSETRAGALKRNGILKDRVRSVISSFEYGWTRPELAPVVPDRRAELNLPQLNTIQEIIEFLGVRDFSELALLADANALSSHGGPDRRKHVPKVPAKLENYWPKRIPKRGGGERLLLVPKPRLREVQRRILRGILEKVPPHAAARGFRKGRGLVDHVLPHVGQRVVMTWDIEQFFPSIHYARVHRVFGRMGYPPKPARILALLCTARQAEERLPWRRALPQGAPTSPAISNLACRRLDARIDGLAKKFGARYTRYADDLAFSGDEKFRKEMGRFIRRLSNIVSEEGYRPHRRKLWIMRSGGRQLVTGLVVNRQPGVPREEADRLRAILHNAKKSGSLASQNRANHNAFRDHLLGRIAWVARFQPGKGAKLRRMLDAIPDDAATPLGAANDALPDAPPGELPVLPPPE